MPGTHQLLHGIMLVRGLEVYGREDDARRVRRRALCMDGRMTVVANRITYPALLLAVPVG
jgi:hypothetical protein